MPPPNGGRPLGVGWDGGGVGPGQVDTPSHVRPRRPSDFCSGPSCVLFPDEDFGSKPPLYNSSSIWPAGTTTLLKARFVRLVFFFALADTDLFREKNTDTWLVNDGM